MRLSFGLPACFSLFFCSLLLLLLPSAAAVSGFLRFPAPRVLGLGTLRFPPPFFSYALGFCFGPWSPWFAVCFLRPLCPPLFFPFCFLVCFRFITPFRARPPPAPGLGVCFAGLGLQVLLFLSAPAVSGFLEFPAPRVLGLCTLPSPPPLSLLPPLVFALGLGLLGLLLVSTALLVLLCFSLSDFLSVSV